MIICKNEETPYCTLLTDGEQSALADIAADEGGQGNGFLPHALLEAGLASCINITIRMYATRHNIPVVDITTRVTMNREHEGKTIFEYQVALTGDITAEQHAKLLAIAQNCPVRKSLSREISFQAL